MIGWVWCAAAQEAVLPVPEEPVEEPRRGPDKQTYEGLETLQRALKAESEGRRASEAELEELREQLRRAAAEQMRTGSPLPGLTQGLEEGRLPVPKMVAPPAPQPMPGVGPGGSPPSGRREPGEAAKTRPQVGERVGMSTVRDAPAPLVFAVPEAPAVKKRVLPAGTYVKTRILTGVEAGDSELVPMTLQADYAAVGPNGTRIDLVGCVLVASVQGELSTDRVVGKAHKLSCVREDDELVDQEIDGYLVGEDSTLGVVGQLISRQGRVMAAATVANLAKGAGEAIALANTTTQVVQNPLGAVAPPAQNVTGSQAAFVVGGSVAEAAEDIADWYLGYAQKLTPAIAVGSGRDVWVVLLEPVEFKGLR